MKVIVTGGGTGGHINPAIAIAQKIKAHAPDAEILYVGTPNGMESDLAPRSGLRYKAIEVKGFRRKLTLDTAKTLGILLKGLVQAKNLIESEKPDLVVGTGGYVCGPVVLLAALKGIKTVIHEQNAVPGATNRILGRFVDTVCVSYAGSEEYFMKAKRVALTGNPVRNEFVNPDRVRCRQALNIPEEAFLVISTGGSGGAGALNAAVKGCFEKNWNKNLFWYHITGKNYYNEFVKGLANCDDCGQRRATAFSHEMHLLLGAADLLVSRSGAIIIAESATAGVPSVLIPSPNVANKHQDYNALFCQQMGMSRIIWEKDLSSDRLWEEVTLVFRDESLLSGMKLSAGRMTSADAVDRILNELEEVLRS